MSVSWRRANMICDKARVLGWQWMKGLTIADRLGAMLPMLVVEVVLLAASALLYCVVVHGKAIRSDPFVAKVFLSFWSICQFAASGAAFAIPIAVISLFQTGQRAS